MIKLKEKAKEVFTLAKTYWETPPKGNYISYKEVASLSGAGFGYYWVILLATAIGLDASNFIVGASIGLKPLDLQVMLIVANLVGIPIGIFRSWYYDNHHMKGGKFLPFLRRTALPMAVISLIFVWLPYENWEYITKAVVVEIMYLLLNIFLCFYNESYTYFQQIISPNAQERANVLSISQIIYSFAPTVTNLVIPLLAGMTWGLNNIWTYRVIYPVFVIVGLVFNTVFFRKVKERLVLPKKPPEPLRIIDAVREVAKNKYYWIIQSAAWVGFLESGYGVVLNWSFVYAYGGKYESYLGLANTVIGNAAFWSMLLAPFAIKYLGKRNLLITANTVNIVVLVILYSTYKNLWIICVLWFFNNFVNTFWNIVQHNIQADMKDYHQWKTGVRVDGLFGPLGMIGTILGFFTGLFYPAVYERMGIGSDYSVLYDDALRNNLFEVIIAFSAVGAFLNLVPFFFYDLTENKHKAYIDVLKIRAMFENYGMGLLDDEQLKETVEIIHRAKELENKEKKNIDKSKLKAARHLPKSTKEEKEYRKEKIKEEKLKIREQKEENLAIERNPIVIEDLNKYIGSKAGESISLAKATVDLGEKSTYDNAHEEYKAAKAMPKSTWQDRQARDFALNLARSKKESVALRKKHGEEYLKEPDKMEKERILNMESSSFKENMEQRRLLKAYMKKESIYNRITKPYREAENYLTQWKNYSEIEKIEERYSQLAIRN